MKKFQISFQMTILSLRQVGNTCNSKCMNYTHYDTYMKQGCATLHNILKTEVVLEYDKNHEEKKINLQM